MRLIDLLHLQDHGEIVKSPGRLSEEVPAVLAVNSTLRYVQEKRHAAGGVLG